MSARRVHFAVVVVALTLAINGCEQQALAPMSDRRLDATTRATLIDPDTYSAAALLLDSLSVGGVYTVLPLGGFFGTYTNAPERNVYSGTIRNHPTGIQLPAGLPVRVVAEGAYTTVSTALFQSQYCAGVTDIKCSVPEYRYSVHGLDSATGVQFPLDPGTGLQIKWSRLGTSFAAPFDDPTFFRGAVPAAGASGLSEVHYRRNAGCCYYIPPSDQPWELYSGRWRFGVIPDNGSRPEAGEPALLSMSGPRTDAAMTEAADFTLSANGGGALSGIRWWFVAPASNTFDGTPMPLAPEPGGTFLIPRYSDSQRTGVTEISSCAGSTMCGYRATTPGAVVAQATLADGSTLAASNRGIGGGAPTLRIISAAGPNPGGSFIVRAPENIIQLRAEISDRSLESVVQWEITDDPTDLLTSRPPASVPPGINSSFAVPSSNIRQDRWPSRIVDHAAVGPDRLGRKSLAFRIVAKVDFQGQTIRSEPVVVRQDEIDTLREEYVEWGQAQVPPRAQIGTQGAASRNTGDYTVWPANPLLVERMPVMQQLATEAWDRQLTVSGGFRNPVHHMIHAGITNPVLNSQHLYGAATDWSLMNPPPGLTQHQYFYAIRRLTKDDRVAGCFEPEDAIRRGASGQLSHAHSDWRGLCPARW